MAKPEYKLRACLAGHTSEIRAVATFSDGTIVSTSRDQTARVWRPNNVANGNSKDYEAVRVLRGHENYVVSVCTVEPSEKYPQGLIVTGSNDNYMCIYATDQEQPIHKIKAHDNAVCKLNNGVEEGTILSSSWDLTAKAWNLNDLSKPELNLVGHTAAVWCVTQLQDGWILTGSADKLIIVWSKTGVLQYPLSGHTDCVRDIVAIGKTEFLSCANDATIRHWNISERNCLRVYYGHENYIYSITATPNGTSAFSSGEDATIRIWNDNGQITQTINMPAQSIWCVSLLSNSDIVCGCSDGLVRIFSCDPERYADKDTLALFEREATALKISNSEEVGGIKVKDLPDPSALQQPGQKDGQIKIVKEDGTAKAYSWSASEQKWIQIGNVISVAGNSSKGAKQLYNGIEYDYVFDVDVQEGVPPLKLPYNNGQDPWVVAQKFLDDNNLSQFYLDHVANFIIKNSEKTPTLSSSGQYADPFTGSSRYIPSSEMMNSTVQDSVQAPYTPTEIPKPTQYFPHTTYLKVESANLSAIADKLRELNATQEGAHQLPQDKLESIIKLGAHQSPEPMRPNDLSSLRILLDWSDDKVFPVLDILRLAILREDVQKHICTDDLLEIVRKHIKPDATRNNQMLVFRLLANMFSYEQGEKLCLKWKDEVLNSLQQYTTLGNKYAQVAISTYMLNLVVAVTKYNDGPSQLQCLNVILFGLSCLKDVEALIRVLVALGTLLSPSSENYKELVSAVRLSSVVCSTLRSMSGGKASAHYSKKVEECAKQICELI